MTLRLENKVALVTGAGSGLGKAICMRFAEEGALVVATDINEDSAKQVVKDIIESGGKATSIKQDVTSEQAWENCIEQVMAEFGRLDVLVNNAGIVIIGTVEKATLKDWQTTQAVNGESVFLGTQSAIKAMQNNGGSIINISSVEGIIGEPLAAAYNYSKGGVRIFTKSAALHCASEGYPIRVNSVHPGFFMTPLLQKGAESMTEEERDDFLTRINASIPMKRMGDPVDIANGCLFLASDEANYITGTELVIDGGYTAR